MCRQQKIETDEQPNGNSRFSPCLARLHDELASRILEKQQMEDSLKGQFGEKK